MSDGRVTRAKAWLASLGTTAKSVPITCSSICPAGRPARQLRSAEIADFLKRNHIRFVPKSDLAYLYTAEENETKARGLSWFKFSDDDEMLSVIERAESEFAGTGEFNRVLIGEGGTYLSSTRLFQADNENQIFRRIVSQVTQ